MASLSLNACRSAGFGCDRLAAVAVAICALVSTFNVAWSGTAEQTDVGAGAKSIDQRATPRPKFLVPASGPCPEMRDGFAMFVPDGVRREVRLFMSEKAAILHGPLIFAWHSTGGGATSALSLLSGDVVEQIMAQGGIVAAPTSGYSGAMRPWDNIANGPKDTDKDQRLMDEVVACALAKPGIDVRRIHSIGWSAGGLKTAQVSLRRSGYIASVVVYSGGLTEAGLPPDQDPTNRFSALVFYGGESDVSPVDGIVYERASRTYIDVLAADGRSAFLCNHDDGHRVPDAARSSAWQFLRDHPFGTYPSPYASQLPTGFVSYCKQGAHPK